MADCECIGGCPFFNDKMEKKPAMSRLLKKKYCQGDYSSCARYMIFKSLGKPAVPGDLYPNMQDRAQQIIDSSK